MGGTESVSTGEVGGVGLGGWTRDGFLTMIVFVDGGDTDDLDVADDPDDVLLPSRGRGAIGTATSPVRLWAGYPSHLRPDLTHFVHCGLVSSHLTRRFLKLEVISSSSG